MPVCHAEDRFRHPVDAKTPLYWSAEDANRAALQRQLQRLVWRMVGLCLFAVALMAVACAMRGL